MLFKIDTIEVNRINIELNCISFITDDFSNIDTIELNWINQTEFNWITTILSIGLITDELCNTETVIEIIELNWICFIIY